VSGFPRLARLHQTMPTAPLAEVAQTVRENLRRIADVEAQGERVAEPRK